MSPGRAPDAATRWPDEVVPAGVVPYRAGPSWTRWQRIQPPVVIAVLVLAGSVALHLRDPHQQGSWGLCPWLLLSGTYCPGCGGLRAVNDLSHGEVLAAASSNLAFVLSIPVLLGIWVRSLVHRWRGVVRPWPPARVNLAWTLAIGSIAVFTVARNLPYGPLPWLVP